MASRYLKNRIMVREEGGKTSQSRERESTGNLLRKGGGEGLYGHGYNGAGGKFKKEEGEVLENPEMSSDMERPDWKKGKLNILLGCCRTVGKGGRG